MLQKNNTIITVINAHFNIYKLLFTFILFFIIVGPNVLLNNVPGSEPSAKLAK